MMSLLLNPKLQARVFIDPPRNGSWNMAIDDAMLDWSGQQRDVLLRVYQWLEPTLSLGYFQKYADRQAIAGADGLAIVRRATGGGAILHHHEITYSIAVPQSDTSLGASTGIYDLVHGVVVRWLNELGLLAQTWTCTVGLAATSFHPRRQATESQPFLCFERRCAGDVVAAGCKLMGSAQRRSQHALLQHGSLLLASSPHTPGLRGLSELLGCGWQIDQRATFAEQLAVRIGDCLGDGMGLEVCEPVSLPDEILTQASSRIDRFGNPQWLCRL